MTSLRPLRPSRFRLDGSRPGIERLEERVRGLVHERQELRAAGAAAGRLEANRIELARAQWQLGNALIERFLAAPAEQDAA